MADSTPSIKRQSFSCPHCGALAHQDWYSCYAEAKEENGLPNIGRPADEFEEWLKALQKEEPSLNEKGKSVLRGMNSRMRLGKVYFREPIDGVWVELLIDNLNVSRCFSCGEMSVWVHDRVVAPHTAQFAPPHQAMPDEIVKDFNEARQIAVQSPRAAAALLRLCVQKLCRHVGADKGDLNDAIGGLVAKGLNPSIQRSLDALRVVGNNAVHPGKMSLEDTSDMVDSLFRMVNLLVQDLIATPNEISAVYDSLPEGAKKAVAKRDGKK